MPTNSSAEPNTNMDKRNSEDLAKAFQNADTIIMKKYLFGMDRLPIVVPTFLKENKEGKDALRRKNFQLFKIERIVYDKEENILDKLATVYNSVSSYGDTSIVMLLNADEKGVSIYLGTACRGKNEKSTPYTETLATSFMGNFLGSEINNDIKDERMKNRDDAYQPENNEDILDEIFRDKSAVSCVSGVSAVRNEKADDNKAYIQGIEKFIESMQGKVYSVIFLADVVSRETVDSICASYEDLYSALYPFSKSEYTINSGEQKGQADTVIKGVTDTINRSISESKGHSHTEGTFSSHSVGGGVNTNVSAGVNVGIKVPGVNVGAQRNVQIGVHADYHYTKGKNESDTQTETKTLTAGTAKSLSEQNSVMQSLTKSNGEALQLSYFNRSVKSLLDRIDEQIKRLRSFDDVGVFDCGVYFLSDRTVDSVSAATKYRAIVRGENSSVESSSINTWTDEDFKVIKQYLEMMYHPLIYITDTAGDKIHSTPTSLVSGRELAVELGLPRKSVPGLPVIECAEFGRNITTYDKNNSEKISIGKIYHMHKEEKTDVLIGEDSLASHAFITGSTGSGKSNTVFTMLDKLFVPFLVIEPAKGEYKEVFGGRKDVSVYGTNPLITPLLKINPFSFPENIMVSEHIDRLVEIFNVCWPMYAAMPAILKDAVIRAYEKAGWDLSNPYKKSEFYPGFIDVLEEIKIVLKESEYSADNKGDYTGALVTRLKSLTNGINGMIFTADGLEDEELFDHNVIIDLSRVGSVETKSMIMGLLVMKLQEYRLSKGEIGNELKHITVLEEAHNLLKRTSTEQSSESANLLGKSVEMLANSIAEIRAFGEGFVIADQAPGLLDMSVIRNTNTKIIHRLPDLSDRELVGKAANLNDAQIEELAKLQCGVAAVYQNNWIQPVLCKVDKFEDGEKKKYKNHSDKIKPISKTEDVRKKIKEFLISANEKLELDADIVKNSALNCSLKLCLLNYETNGKVIVNGNIKDKAEIAYRFFKNVDIAKLWEKSYGDPVRLGRFFCQAADIEIDDNNIKNLYYLISMLSIKNKDNDLDNWGSYTEINETINKRLI